MRKTSQLSNLFRRIRVTIFILLVYMMGCSIPVPYAKTTAQFTRLVRDSPLGIASFMSGANLQQISLFMVGINPMMIAMMLMQVLMMVRLFHFDTLSANQVAYLQQILILALAILQSTTTTIALHLTSSVWRIAAVVLMLTAGSMFVMWLCFMNMQFGIGGSITIIMFNIIVSSLPNIRRAVKSLMKLSHPYLWLAGLVVIAVLFAIFWLAFNKAYYPVKVVNVLMDSHSKLVVHPIGLNMGAMMTYMVGMALLTVPLLLAGVFGRNSIWAQSWFQVTFCAVMTFLLFYFFAFVQFSPYQQAKSFRNNNMYIPGIHPGKPTQRHLARLVWFFCFPGAVFNSIQLTLGLTSQYYLMKYSGFAIIPMNILMIIMILNGVKDNVLTLIFPHKYAQFSQRGEK